DYLNVNTSSRAKSLVSRLFRLGFGKGNSGKKRQTAKPKAEIRTPEKIDVKKVYVLHDDGTERNFVLPGCCSPLPGDDVMGYLNYDGQVEIHSLSCPHGQKLKAGHGDRLLAVEWDKVDSDFIANIHVEGIDRHGILQELTGVISGSLEIDMRRLNIEAHGEVFSCDLDVKVSDVKEVTKLCAAMRKVDGVRSVARVK
ncbi:MAG: GTP pyrophosphokinase, partial [Duncaniella sp.]|nr:GTP pyrophosphokinase [Duncaniella sp.]